MRIRIAIGESAIYYTFIELIPHTDAELRPAILYKAGNKSITITANEYRDIRAHPKRYYFSTELKVYLRCQRDGHKFSDKETILEFPPAPAPPPPQF